MTHSNTCGFECVPLLQDFCNPPKACHSIIAMESTIIIVGTQELELWRKQFESKCSLHFHEVIPITTRVWGPRVLNFMGPRDLSHW